MLNQLPKELLLEQVNNGLILLLLGMGVVFLFLTLLVFSTKFLSFFVKKYFPEKVWHKNYSKHIARQMPVSLYGISFIFKKEQIAHRYVGAFKDAAAIEEIREHLLTGRPVVIETSRMKRENGRIVKWFDKKYAGSYHTMIILGLDESGEAVFTDSATRAWAGDRQRLKKATLEELITYMFPQKKTEDTHVYFSRRKNTGGYILVDEG